MIEVIALPPPLPLSAVQPAGLLRSSCAAWRLAACFETIIIIIQTLLPVQPGKQPSVSLSPSLFSVFPRPPVANPPFAGATGADDRWPLPDTSVKADTLCSVFSATLFTSRSLVLKEQDKGSAAVSH